MPTHTHNVLGVNLGNKNCISLKFSKKKSFLICIRAHRYMSTLYSHPDFPNKGPKDINKELMKRVSSNPLRLLLPQHITNYIQALWTKKARGQPVTFTDIFGMLIGETLIPAVRASSHAGLSVHICPCLLLLQLMPWLLFRRFLDSHHTNG